MIRDIIKANEDVQANSRELEILKKNFPQCFDANGNFDMAIFEELVKTKDISLKKEGYALNFLGKSYARYLSNLDSETVIVPDESNKDNPSENVYIVGDNLDALQHLKHSYFGAIKCIYIDPPYNTGSDGFVYNDKFEFTAKDLAVKIGIEEDDAERILNMQGKSTHSAWLTFMYPRLELAKELLTDDGVILISIDDNEQANCKLLCDSIFGETCYLGTFIWYKKLTGGYDNEDINTQHEYILCYCSNPEYFKINLRDVDSKYKLTDPKTGKKFKWDSLWNVGGLTYSKSLDYAIIAPDGSEVYPIGKRGVSFWLWSKERVEKERDELKFEKDAKGQWKIYKKVFASDGLIPGSITLLDKNKVGGNTTASNEIKSLFEGNKVFDYPKPTKLLIDLIDRFVSSDDIVLDFFSGSGSCADAIMQLSLDEKHRNLHYIMVQLHELIYQTKDGKEMPLDKKAAVAAFNLGYRSIDEIGRERIRRAAAKIKKDEPKKSKDVDLGFKTYYLKTPEKQTLDRIIDFNPSIPLDSGDIIKAFGKDTILETWKIKDGYGFNTSIKESDLKGYTAYLINDGVHGANLYLLDEISESGIMELVRQLEANELIADKIIEYGYALSYTANMSLRTNLKTLKNRNPIDVVIRY